MIFNRYYSNRFTLLELIATVVIISLLAAMALPAYQKYAMRASAAQAEQEMQRIVTLLEKNKSRNFNYRGFQLEGGGNSITLPVNALTAQVKYEITVRDGTDTTKKLTDTTAQGFSWVIMAQSKDSKNFGFLMTSTGVKCKNKTSSLVNYSGCGTGSEAW